jgi:hypothetical protein
MSMAEVAYQIKDCANILVGPEGLGYSGLRDNAEPYDQFLSSLVSNSSMLPNELATDVVTDYLDWWLRNPYDTGSRTGIQNATMSAVDLTKIASLTAAIDDLATSLKQKEDIYHEQIDLARNQTHEQLGPFANDYGFYIDLYNFAQLTFRYVPDAEIRNASDQLMTALSIGNTIITEAEKVDPDSHGLAIFFPNENGKYDSYNSTYRNTAFSIDTPWDELVEYHLTGHDLTIHTPYPNMQVKINEDQYTTNASGIAQVFVSPGSYTLNLTALFSTAVDARGVFTGWKDGNTSNPRTVDIGDRNLEVEAEYKTQYRLIMNANLGAIDPPIGEYWYDNGSGVNLYAYSPSLFYQPNQEQYDCRWIGTGNSSYSGTSNSSITVRGPVNETVAWTHKYLLTVTYPSYDSTTPVINWTEAGTSINASVTSPALEPSGKTRYVCTGWIGTGSGPASGTSTAVTFTIDKPSIITWNWKTQYLLTVFTDPAGLNPQPTRNPLGEAGPENGWWYDNGTRVNCTAQAVNGYVFDQWSVDEVYWDVDPVPINMSVAHNAEAHYEHAQTWWGLLTRPDVLQALLAIVGMVVTVSLIGTAWIRNRRGRNIVKAYSDEIDEVYSSHRIEPQKCEEELRALRNTILEGLTDGKIGEETYNVLDKKIDKYMAELDKQKKT